MALYTADSIERVKEAVDMVELVGARTDLRRAGARFTGLCPFHDERTPSFSVNADAKLYHCFGCGQGGDAIRFVQETEALDFKEAIELLAERYNVELKREQEDPQAEERRRRRERLQGVVERTVRFYERYLWESGEAERARSYLEQRGLSKEVLEEFRVGYSPSAWDRVVVGAQRDGFSEQEIAASGLGQRGKQGKLYDRFRGRIMFPLADARGRVLGFGARALRVDQKPKYLNTSENELYHKGRQLFGIDRARAHAAKAGRVVVVEGYTDVLALHQAGIREAVAIMGTALTQEQLAELSRAAPTVFLALDADRAGLDAMQRAARAARDRDVELRVVALPEGSDPADLISSEGTDRFGERLERAMSVTEFQLRRVLADADLGTPRGRDIALEQVRPLLASIPAQTATHDELASYVADKLDVPVSYLTTQLASPPQQGLAARTEVPSGRPDRQGTQVSQGASLDAVLRAERAFLAMCLGLPRPGREYLDRLDDAHLSSQALREVRDWLRGHYEAPLVELPSGDPAFAALVTEVVAIAEEEPVSETVVRLSFLQLDLRRIERELRHAEREQDFDRQRALWGEREEVRDQIGRLMGEAA